MDSEENAYLFSSPVLFFSFKIRIVEVSVLLNGAFLKNTLPPGELCSALEACGLLFSKKLHLLPEPRLEASESCFPLQRSSSSSGSHHHSTRPWATSAWFPAKWLQEGYHTQFSLSLQMDLSEYFSSLSMVQGQLVLSLSHGLRWSS